MHTYIETHTYILAAENGRGPEGQMAEHERAKELFFSMFTHTCTRLFASENGRGPEGQMEEHEQAKERASPRGPGQR